DKYSSRKIIKDCLGVKPNLDEICNLIYSDIFKLTMTDESIQDMPLEESLSENNKDFLHLIEQYDAEYIRTNLDNIIEELCNDQ
ncbi:hypothetical protein CGH51_25345, partial [Vibrio parahaemolyticus]